MQVVAVAKPSKWQQNYQPFNKDQLGLLAKAQHKTEAFEVMGK